MGDGSPYGDRTVWYQRSLYTGEGWDSAGSMGYRADEASLQLHKACSWKQKSAAHSYLALLFASFTDSCLSRM